MKGKRHAFLCRRFACSGVAEDGEQLLIMLFERPLTTCAAGGLRGRQPSGGIEKFSQTIGEAAVIVRVVDDEAIVRRAKKFAGAVGFCRDHRQSARQGFEGDERARVVKGRVD